ncbi:zinc ABC transporter permease subunit ZnuB [Zooshikella ganghwensis]|uniref:High-affinity zinc uptake system membrane protein ZnuB n=1 Tax=Zooshikella ganghwensis TaxID=202772 RepID=A0A4P9VUI1_9GAMM|nr:zinc ABC transporter permease subunit ZnuB [Zooshikella ganghwensis]RDH41962.1 zinc ABC transporter permease subunit ZnuB [Zooshikella ganghwensis]RDH46579.1 zinc ABC transporter permease subunit ZnuB [Zooshikella ganghwensis]
MIEFLVRACLAGLGIAVIAGPLGCFVVWRRMAYFGDTLAHSALLGIALGIMLEVQLNIAVIICCILLALLLVTLQQNRNIATDTLLGILAHSTLSLGLVIVSLMDNIRIDLMGYLFGDLLAVNNVDLLWIYSGGILVIGLVCWLWRPLLSITIHEELARVEGIPVNTMRMVLMLLIAMVIAVAMKIVGVLLITSLLIIPAATARKLAASPEKMAIWASGLGCLAVILGIALSYYYNTPTGPSVVVAAGLLFILVTALPMKRSC